MSRIVTVNSVSLDGVMQAPGRPDEDTRGGFRHGGWALPYSDEVLARTMGPRMAGTGSLLLGRRTYEDFHGYWPHQPADNPFVPLLNETMKYVASTTLTEPLPWRNSTLLTGDVPRAVTALRDRPGKDVVVLGSGALLRTLIRHDLVDEYVLLIHPLLLGAGLRLFDDGVPPAGLRLVDSVTTGTGVVLATYRREGER
ncbi:MAG TPA: dihydrofolate reductase family protein [Actinophytocola sp.]|nr:dihydrofolate reductase family protein [Actinophytocola sp.]